MRRPPPSQRAMSLGRVHGGVWPARPCPKRERGATTMERLWTALQPIAQRLTNVPKEEAPVVWEGTIMNVKLAFRPAQFYVQGALVALSVLYLLIAFAGRAVNRWRVRAWHQRFGAALQKEFVQVGADAASAQPVLLWNGPNEACLFATGRRGIDTLHANVWLRPWHDILYICVSLLYDVLALPAVPWFGPETVTVQMALPSSPRVNGGTFAIIDKTELVPARHGRYDMLFAKVLDAENASRARGLDERFAIATESGDITDKWLGEVGPRGDAQRAKLGLIDTLNSNAGRLLVSLLFTDQPRLQPEYEAVPETQRVERLELTMRLPRTAVQLEGSVQLLTLCMDLIDALHLTATGKSKLMALRPETHVALKKTRAEAAEALSEILMRDTKAEAAEAAEEERLRLQKEKFDKLSPAEQAKRKELAKRRSQRKAQMKEMRRRM